MNCILKRRAGASDGGGNTPTPTNYTVTIQQQGNLYSTTGCSAQINGTYYYGSSTSVTVASGTTVTLRVGGSSGYTSYCSITVNGSKVVNGKAGSYNITITKNTTIRLQGYDDGSGGYYGVITVV